MSPIKPLASQFHGALSMLSECLAKCPADHWDAKIAHYSFWQVAYHTLCFVDCYLARSDAEWAPRQDPTAPGGGLHPKGRAELDEEFPSRRFEKDELLRYVEICRDLVDEALGRETEQTLEGPSGFPHLPFSRFELHLYNLRHVQHHTGQLTASLRRVGVETKWCKAGRR